MNKPSISEFLQNVGPAVRQMGLKQQLKKLGKKLPPGGRVFMLHEGEQVPSRLEHPGNLVIRLANMWRPEGQAIPDHIEAIPVYVRPANWREIQEREDRQPGRMEIV